MIREREWILTNKKGGYAIGPENLLNYRKYHGLLIASSEEIKRVHLVASIEEMVSFEDKSFYLDSNHYPGVIYPEGYKHLILHFLRPFPTFIYSTHPPHEEIVILKSIKMHRYENFTVVQYKNAGKKPIKLSMRPKFTMRDHHTLHPPGYWDSAEYSCEIDGKMASFEHNGIKVFVFSSKGNLSKSPIIYRNVTYPAEMMRGYDCVEDLISPFFIEVELNPDEEMFVAFSDEERELDEKIKETILRYKKYPLPYGHPEKKEFSLKLSIDRPLFKREEYMEILKLAMEDFIADDDLIAGFPWFSAWGRDTMISLPALQFIDGGKNIIKRILKKYLESMKDGLIPNFKGDGKEGYEAIDPVLWFGLRVLEFINLFEKKEREDFLLALSQTIEKFLKEPPLPFHIDPEDGLIEIHRGTNLALTWMDAKVFGEPVTPRYGKPVEINALWFNLLKGYSRLKKDSLSKEIKKLLPLVKKGMEKFYHEDGFADRIEDGNPVLELRPNYIIALSLPEVPYKRAQIEKGYKIAKEKLLTPYGLRSLSPDHPSFRSHYMGDQRMRDLAYHQGTVWVWLIYPMALVANKLYKRNKRVLLSELNDLILRLRDEIENGRMASVPELYDGEDPKIPKGAPAQCWSVAALLSVEKMIEEIEKR
jgi:predicted glycogen debranching enzyme